MHAYHGGAKCLHVLVILHEVYETDNIVLVVWCHVPQHYTQWRTIQRGTEESIKIEVLESSI